MARLQETLQQLREAAGLSMEQMAELLGFKRASSWHYYESDKGYRGDLLPFRLTRLLIEKLEGKGRTPLTRDQLVSILAPISENPLGVRPGPIINRPYVALPVYEVDHVEGAASFIAGDETSSNQLFLEADLKRLHRRSRRGADIPPAELKPFAFVTVRGQVGSNLGMSDGDQLLVNRYVRAVDRSGTYLIWDNEIMFILYVYFEPAGGAKMVLNQKVQEVDPAALNCVGQAIWRGEAVVP